MDIVVTVPKHEIDHFEKDKVSIVREGGEAWWFVRNLPLKSKDGDRIYFVLNGQIKYVGRIYDMDYRETSSYDGTLFLKPAVIFDLINEINPPIPMKGFQGFRYYKTEDIKDIG